MQGYYELADPYASKSRLLTVADTPVVHTLLFLLVTGCDF